MSTYYGVLNSVRDARNLVDLLLRSGAGPDNVSLVGPPDALVSSTLGAIGGRGQAPVRGEIDSMNRMYEEGSTTGDTSAFVGAPDDPEKSRPFDQDPEYACFTYQEVEPYTSGIDTSNRITDVETVDQSNESQEAFEDLASPPEGISHGEHEHDDINLTVLTGFPTIVPMEDDVIDTATPEQLAATQGFEVIVVPEKGIVGGGGSLATAALDVMKPGSDPDADWNLAGYLKDEGVDDVAAKDLVDALHSGKAIVAVEITPGEMDEEGVERLFAEAGAQQAALFDAPRY